MTAGGGLAILAPGSSAPPGAALMPASSILGSLGKYTDQDTVSKYVYGAAPQGAVNLLTVPAGNAGVVRGLVIMTGGDMALDGRIQITANQAGSPQFDCDTGTMFAGHFSAQGTLQPFLAQTRNWTSAYNNFSQMVGMFTHDIPFTNGIVINHFNPNAAGGSNWSSGGGDATQMFYELTVETRNSAAVPPYLLSSSACSYGSFANNTNNQTTNGNNLQSNVGGFALTSPDLAFNGPGLTALGAQQMGQLMSVTGKGWIVGLSYVAHQSTTPPNFLERSFALYRDGNTQPVLGGSYSQGVTGLPTGTAVGTWQRASSGTEDMFRTPFYGMWQNLNVGTKAAGAAWTFGNAPTVGASPWTYTNANLTPLVVYFTGGTGVSATIGGVSVGTFSTTGITTLTLNPTETLVLTYTTVPTMVVSQPFVPSGATTISTPVGAITSNPNNKQGTFGGFRDMWDKPFRYNNGAGLWLLPDSHTALGHNLSWCVWYYRDISPGSGVG